jgi:hypothetical protein
MVIDFDGTWKNALKRVSWLFYKDKSSSLRKLGKLQVTVRFSQITTAQFQTAILPLV